MSRPLPPATDPDELARAHMRAQVRSAAAVQTLTAELWARYIDPDDFARSYARLRFGVAALVRQGRARGALLADRYLIDALDLADLDPRNLARWVDDLDSTHLLIALDAGAKANVTTRELAAIANATSPRTHAEVLTASLNGLLSVAKARVAAGGTDRLLMAASRDGRIKRWARVSDGSPCSRCALLVSRGPVYLSQSAAVTRRHDGCGCSARLVIGDDDGWSPEARHYRAMWNDARDESAFRADLTHLTPRFDPLAAVDFGKFAYAA